MSYEIAFKPILFYILKQEKIIKLKRKITALMPYTEYWIVMSHKGDNHTTRYGNKYPLAHYSILNNRKKPSDWRIGNFRITSIRDNMNYLYSYTTLYSVKDANGTSKDLLLSNVGTNDFISHKHSVEEVYHILKGLSNAYENWDEFGKSGINEIETFLKKFENTSMRHNANCLKVVWDQIQRDGN